MPEPPQPNPDGTYTFSAEAVQELRNAIYRLAQARNDAECIAAIDTAHNILPIPPPLEQQKKEAFEANIQKQMLEYEAANKREPQSPEIAALERALKERHAKEIELLNHRQTAERKQATAAEIPDLIRQQAKEQRDHLTKFDTDLKRYTQEAKESQKLIKEIEDRELTRKPDDLKRTL